MSNPLDFTKTAAVAQSIITSFYVTVGVVVYRYAGDFISSPALGTAGPLMKKICYGIAIPALLVSATMYVFPLELGRSTPADPFPLLPSTSSFCHMSGKYIFVRALRGTRHLTGNTAIHWIVWLGCVIFSTISAFLIAEGV